MQETFAKVSIFMTDSPKTDAPSTATPVDPKVVAPIVAPSVKQDEKEVPADAAKK